MLLRSRLVIAAAIASQVACVQQPASGPPTTPPPQSNHAPAPAPSAPAPPPTATEPSNPDDARVALSAEVVLDRVQRIYMRGLKRCYADLLKVDATAYGRVHLKFVVDETGSVTNATATSDFASFSACVEADMTNWAFPIPGDSKEAPSTASFSMTLNVQPD
jgi:outer membrane biosynthesis protein TonB